MNKFFVAVVLVLLFVSVVVAQVTSPGFENCTGHMVPPSLPWYRPVGSSAMCVSDVARTGTYAVANSPSSGYNAVCQNIASGAGTVDVSLWCRTSGNHRRGVSVVLRAAGGVGADIDAVDTAQKCQRSNSNYNQHSVSLIAPSVGNYAVCFGNGPGDTSVYVTLDDITVSAPPMPTPTPTPISGAGSGIITASDVEMSDGMLAAMGTSLGTFSVVGIALMVGVFLSKVFKGVFGR